MGKSETLGDGEAIICSTKEMAYDEAYVSLGQIKLDVVKKADRFITDGDDAMQIFPSFYIFVGDFESVVSDIMAQGEGGMALILNGCTALTLTSTSKAN